MRLVTFRSDGEARLGAVRDGYEIVEIETAKDMLALIDAGEEGLSRARAALSSSRSRAHRVDSVQLLAPIPEPRGNVIAMGRNYQKHAEESAKKENGGPQPPTIFTKAITSLTEPFADIVIDPAISDQMDWEVELAVVVGKRGANIRLVDARSHVFGYMVLNDVSARDVQFGWGGQFFKGKSLDRTSPCGPWIVTADEISDPQQLRLSLRVNGKTEQEGTTHDMIYPVDAIIEWASKGMTLPAGAIISTGTPDGVGFYRTPPVFLRPGDVMESEVEKIGVLRNRIVAAHAD